MSALCFGLYSVTDSEHILRTSTAGTIPVELENLSALRQLYLHGNKLIGELRKRA